MKTEEQTTADAMHNPNYEIVEKHIGTDGTLWLRVWKEILPGMMQLVWIAPNGIVKRKSAKSKKEAT